MAEEAAPGLAACALLVCKWIANRWPNTQIEKNMRPAEYNTWNPPRSPCYPEPPSEATTLQLVCLPPCTGR
eukprot:11963899-Alexandrium_andersonii.AAC.1